MRPALGRALGVLAAVALAFTACGRERAGEAGGAVKDPADSVLVVFNAGALARPLKAALDSFAAREGIVIQQESSGSLETARKLTELGKIPDVLALADRELFPALLMPRHVGWFAEFARNRMVIAYTPQSRRANELTAKAWPDLLLHYTIESGFSDPAVDPAGYRTVLAMRLAERHYARPGLADSLRRRVPARNVRPKSADLVALLQAGELDYAWMYESVARGARLRFLTLPPEIDLGDQAHAAGYAAVSVRVPGRTPRESLTVRGEPIVFALTVPYGAPHPALAERAAAFLLSPAGRTILRAEALDVLALPRLDGAGVPPSVVAATRAADPAPPR